MKVKDVMVREVKSLSPEVDVSEALDLLLKMQISGLPVIDENNKLVGMFTEKEVLSKILPSYIERVGAFTYKEDPKTIKQKITQLGTLKVKDLMRREVVTVDEDCALYEAAHLMLTKKARRIPVLNKAKEVVGIIARVDIVKALFSKI